MFYVVYKTINNINKKEYIGVHKMKSVTDPYLGSGILIKKAILKYGKTNFSRIILKIFKNKKDAFEFESYVVDNKYVNNSNTYNLKTGGQGTKVFTKDMKLKSSKKLGHPVTIVKEGNIIHFDSIIKAAEYIKVSKQSLYPILKNKGNCSTAKGWNVCYTKDYNKNMIFKKVNKGKPRIEVLKLTKENIIIKRYNSISEAAKENNLRISGISLCVNNKQNTCGNFKWKKYEK